jgi:hypothetical protein
MLRALLFIITIISLSGGIASGQPLATYTNMQNEVMVWDKGMIRKVDYLPPRQLKIGRSAIAYLDNSGSFRIYYGNGVRTINPGYTNAFFTSDYLVAFLNASSLNVFEKGNIKNLTTLCEQYYLGDSVLVYLDGLRRDYKAYYNGQVYPVENFLGDTAIYGIKVTDNMVAYNNYANQFRLFYHGETIAQEDYAVSSFDAGRNTVAYVDANRTFKIFHSGQTYLVENFPPISYHVGDNVVAYVSTDGYFKIFYEDSVRTIGYFTPEYVVGDYVVAYRDASGYLKAFYKGEITQLESYYPDNFTIQYNSIAYVNRANILRLFSEGEIYDVTNASLDNWELNYDVIKYQIGRNIFRFFYKGREY